MVEDKLRPTLAVGLVPRPKRGLASLHGVQWRMLAGAGFGAAAACRLHAQNTVEAMPLFQLPRLGLECSERAQRLRLIG